ncbi:CHAT domain-containing protein [Seonamhaeicola sp. NFXS20]|uniref:CHAT domain-containing protein n=1 Tax=Seonamhaeicola sp. NFXS20 TaxID=2816959 RepID=UPI003B8D8BDE
MKKLLYFLVFIHGFCFSQELEEQIYLAAETFIANPNEASLQILNKQELRFKSQVKTKDEQLALVFLQSHKGYYLQNHSNLKEAITTFEDAVKRFNNNNLSKLSDFDIIESCLIPLGNLYTKTGNFTNAESIIKQYTYLAKKKNLPKHEISGAINLSQLYYTLGKHETVIKLTSDFINNPNISKSQKQKLINLKNESQIALGTISEKATLNNKLYYKIALQNANYSQALLEFKKFKKQQLAIKNLSKREIAQIYIEEAQIYHVNNQNTAALKSLEMALQSLIPNTNFKSLPKKELLYAENKFIDIFDLYSNIETTPELALKSYDLSFHVSHLLKNTWTTQEAKILNETNNRIRSEKCINLLFDTFNNTQNDSLLFKAFEYSENSKVFTLKEMFLKKQRLEKHPTDSLLNKEYNLLKQQELITSKLIIEQLENNSPTEINNLSKQLSEISLKIKSLQIPISKKYPALENPIPTQNLQNKLLKDNAVLVEYFYGKQAIYQFVISSTSITLNKLTETDNAKKAITNYIHLFDDATKINNNVSNYTLQAFNLYQLLNFKEVSAYKNVIVIPDGLLNFMPFETLLNSKTTTTSFSKMPFVVKFQNIAYNSSAFFYLNNSQIKTNNKLLGIFPVFNNSTKHLSFSLQEANAIKKEINSEMLINDNASKTNFIKKAKNYNILHLSTHASSGNFVEPASIDFYNEKLYVNELYSLNLNSNLVVLSACETGVGKLFKAEGAMSIARGFQYAGAKNLLFTLWQINDLSTSQIMQSFYKNYSNTQSAYYSNQTCKLEYLENPSISNAKKSPYYWGAFVYYGESSQPISKPYLLYGIILGFILLIILLLRFKLK